LQPRPPAQVAAWPVLDWVAVLVSSALQRAMAVGAIRGSHRVRAAARARSALWQPPEVAASPALRVVDARPAAV
jgi:hypothetical protein